MSNNQDVQMGFNVEPKVFGCSDSMTRSMQMIHLGFMSQNYSVKFWHIIMLFPSISAEILGEGELSVMIYCRKLGARQKNPCQEWQI
jgi:hypothetical protein